MTDPQPISALGAADAPGERRSLWSVLREAVRRLEEGRQEQADRAGG